MADQVGIPPQLDPRENLVWPVVLTIVAFLVAYRSPVSYTTSDSLGTLLTAEALARYGTIELDTHAHSAKRTYIGNVNYLSEDRGKFRLQEGHIYHYSPLGTALFSVPFVWLENLRGNSMVDPNADGALQNALSAGMVAISFILVYLIVRRFVPAPYSVIVSIGCVFGGPLMSTMGTALWNGNLAALLVLGALLLLMRTENARTLRSGLVLGALLFFAYLARPTTLPFALLVFILVGRRSKRQLVGTALTFVTLMVFFLAFSWSEFGALLPDYYIIRHVEKPSRYLLLSVVLAALFCAAAGYIFRLFASKAWRHTDTKDSVHQPLFHRRFAVALGVLFLALITALIIHPGIIGKLYSINKVDLQKSMKATYGLLLSPSRGLVVYSPFLIITLIGSIQAIRKKRTSPLFWLCVAWLVVHTLILSRPYRWHGGHCYGPRLFTEAFPAAVLLTAFAWNSLYRTNGGRGRVLRVALWITVLAGVFINTYQGMYNRYTTAWNTSPNIDSNPEYLFSWRYPQFLATPGQLEARNLLHERRIRLQRRMEIEAAKRLSQGSANGPTPGAE